MLLKDVIGVLKEKKLLVNLFNVEDNLDMYIENISIHTNSIKSNSLFVCRKGYKYDSHALITEALKDGAVGFIVERPVDYDSKEPMIQVTDSRYAESVIASFLHDNPHEKLKTFAVTGTNGKTTVSTMIHYLLSRIGLKGTLMGTVENIVVDRSYDSYNTTATALEIVDNTKETIDKGGTFLSMEVSSHALSMKRVESMQFDYAIMTNITHDHLDYHNNMQEYIDTKFHLIELLKSTGTAILNVDDTNVRKMIGDIPIDKKISTYGMKREDCTPDYSASNINADVNGIEFDFYIKNKKIKRIKVPIIGDFNVYNVLPVLAMLDMEGYNINYIAKYLQSFRGVPGRFELYSHIGNDIDLVVDFAHTPDALEKVLKNAKSLKRSRVIAVFGAGGDSDKKKRPLMGKIASELADVVIITSDNPKSENPLEIIKEIEAGMGNDTPYLLVEDRKLAIETALNLSNKGDLVVLAGKGHEKYQYYEHTFFPLNDRAIAFQMIRTLKHHAS
ncbi:MAG TPA: UDP-N-acetylmuramoyl-L-alanyl-D-glutamate--2,6-diaminopimelate ligase [Thermotogota bacterium]|nr:UDP-N-acetylmuramoyl-L-alanyl-D-glutamate--2,6-diaminopimelate ligase [Thermotogota bacterium]HRW33737.1 UDP-N-acetylmuramoyl-L-alanyl-D-glutamate--2,6-diaminopimelate ligase [Thermotogota bacterium]